MATILKNLFRARRTDAEPSTLPIGQRVYAVGDVHGQHDLLERLLSSIRIDDDSRPEAQTTIVFLGDLVDRGPDTSSVVETLRRLALDACRFRFLAGNHEEIFLAAWSGNERAVRAFCRMGGRETLLSYGVTAQAYERMDHVEVTDALRACVPAAHIDFLSSFETSITLGDYMFVHAGVDPNLPLDAQTTAGLRWIRQPFLGHPERLEKVVVHGHTVSPQVEWRAHRIGIDTGAYQTGCLTALGLEGESRWLVQT